MSVTLACANKLVIKSVFKCSRPILILCQSYIAKVLKWQYKNISGNSMNPYPKACQSLGQVQHALTKWTMNIYISLVKFSVSRYVEMKQSNESKQATWLIT